ncbi:MAG: queuosine precursor transporter [Cyclobacteriaceae bacterium]|nr:queuosine precursor transporter [Cyclobacteriaceae bacterium]
MKSISQKKANLFLILGGIFITNAIVAELVGGKIFSLEGTLGISQFQIPLMGEKWDFNLTAGVILWPVVFITTDIINEYFGKEGVRKISLLTVILIVYVFIAVFLITLLLPADFWLDANNQDDAGNYLNISYAFNRIFRQGMWIIAGSLVAFLVGQLLDAYIFHKFRRFTGKRLLWVRATGSTLVSQFIDSFVVLFIAFYISGQMSFSVVIAIGIVNYFYKFMVAIIITPFLYLAHYLIDNYLGKELAGEMMEDAAGKSKTFF